MEVGTSSVMMLPYTASSVGVARRRLMAELIGAGVFETTACDASLVLSELLSNALRHATPLSGGVVGVTWELGEDRLEVAVSDGGGATSPVVHQPGNSAIGGRGLGIVDRLALRWGVYARPGETTVWAELPLNYDGDHDPRSAPEDMAESNRDSEGAGEQGLVIASSRDA
jgi:anti-sigma regulatory factor (Ser/Thr protein kinase)